MSKSSKLELFKKSLHKNHLLAQDLCKTTDCFAVYYGYADYGDDNLVKHYELFLTPVSKDEHDEIDKETILNYPNRAIFMAYKTRL